MPLGIRTCNDAHVAAVVELWRACGLLAPHNDPVADIAFCRSGPRSELFVGEENGRVVASVMTGDDGHRGWLYYVAVAPPMRGRGFGREMVRHAEAWLAESGVAKANLQIRDTNAAVQAFYARLGYRADSCISMGRRLGGDTPASTADEPAVADRLRIRPFDERHRNAVIELWRACAVPEVRASATADIARCRAAPCGVLLVGEEFGRVVGTVLAGHDGHRGWIYRLGVDPAQRGRGFGGILVRRAEAWLARLGVPKVNLLIDEADASARRFYESLGYEMEPRIKMGRRLRGPSGAAI